MRIDLAVIAAVYNSIFTVKPLIDRIRNAFDGSGISLKLILVDDFSTDGTAELIDRLAQESREITAIHLKKNSGQQNALLCGLRHAQNCRYAATIDDDLQQPPETLRLLYERITELDADIVYAVPNGKHSKLYRRAGSAMRDAMFSVVTKKPKDITVSSFRIMNADTAKQICCETQQFVYLSASAFRRSVRASEIHYERNPRPHGRSGYTPKKLAALYWNLFVYYTRAGALFRPKEQKEPYEISRIVMPGCDRKRLLILGGSLCQMHAFELAESLGYQTVLADYLPNPPAAHYADLHLRISTFDRSACLHAASQLHVNGVMTLGTDQPVYTAAFVSERLGLPFPISESVAYTVTNKKAMKAVLKQANIPTAAWRLIDSTSAEQDLEALSCPLVIKPLDSQGQRGIFKLNTPREILDHLKETLSYSAENEALVEEYYPSDEITVSAWVSDGTLFVLGVTDRIRYPDDIHIGICTEHRFPSRYLNRFRGEILPICQRIVSAFGIKNGPLYIQMLVGNEGIFVNELACRIGGAFEDVFLPYLSGFDLLDATMKVGLGEAADTSALQNYDVCAVKNRANVQLMFCESGTLASVTPKEEILALPFVKDAGWNFKPGDIIPSVDNATARFGHCVFVSDGEPLEASVKEFYDTIRVCSEEGENLIRIPDAYRQDDEGDTP